MINQNGRSLSAFITNELEQVFAIIILILNILLIFWISVNYRSIIQFYIRIMDPTLLKMHTLIFILSALRIQAYSYAVGGCFLKLQGLTTFEPSVFRTLQSSSYIFYDLTLGIIGAKWIGILQKFFHYFKRFKALETILIVVLAIFWFVCQIFLVITEIHNGKIWNDSTEKTFSILYFIQSLLALFIFVIGCLLFRRHLKNIHTITDQYKKKLDIALCSLVFGLLLRIAFLQLKIWCHDWLVSFKYGFKENSDEDFDQDSQYWSIISFSLFLLSDFIPTVILLQIFSPKRQNATQSVVKESTLVEIE